MIGWILNHIIDVCNLCALTTLCVIRSDNELSLLCTLSHFVLPDRQQVVTPLREIFDGNGTVVRLKDVRGKGEGMERAEARRNLN